MASTLSLCTKSEINYCWDMPLRFGIAMWIIMNKYCSFFKCLSGFGRKFWIRRKNMFQMLVTFGFYERNILQHCGKIGVMKTKSYCYFIERRRVREKDRERERKWQRETHIEGRERGWEGERKREGETDTDRGRENESDKQTQT